MNSSKHDGINRDGTFRAKRIGINRYTLSEVYSTLVTISWGKFFLLILGTYLILALVFTLAYFFADFQNVKSLMETDNSSKFWETFLYSAQTMSTVGGTGLIPVGLTNNLILTVESMTALLCATIITGLLYARFSRPSAKIVYSDRALISPYKEGNALMIRISNARKIELVELSAFLLLVLYDPITGKRNFTDLHLEQNKLPFNATTWTIVHAIDEKSPFFNLDRNQHFYISTYISAIDSVTGQNVSSRHGYLKEDVIWNAKFLPCWEMSTEGEALVYLNKIGAYEEIK